MYNTSCNNERICEIMSSGKDCAENVCLICGIVVHPSLKLDAGASFKEEGTAEVQRHSAASGDAVGSGTERDGEGYAGIPIDKALECGLIGEEAEGSGIAAASDAGVFERGKVDCITCSGPSRHHICFPDLNSYMEHNVLCQIYKLRFNRGEIFCPEYSCKAAIPLVAAFSAFRPEIRRRYQAIMSSGTASRSGDATIPPLLNEAISTEVAIRADSRVPGGFDRSVRNAILECLSLQCPHCQATVDPAPDACAAISCMNCGLFYCNCCFKGFGNYSPECKDRGSAEAHEHCAIHDEAAPPESRSAFLSASIISLGQQKCRRDKIVRTLLLARVDEEVTGHLDATQGSESRRSRIGYSMRDIELGLILASQELSDMNLSATELFDEICKASAVTVMSGTAGAWTGEGGGSYTRGADSADLEEARSLLAQLSNAIIFRNEAAIAQLMSARRVFALLSPNTICPRQQESLLMLATMSGAEDLAVELLRRGGDMLMKIQHGNLIGKRNALFVAVELGLCRLLDAALSQGVSLDSQVCFEDQFALRPMHVAAQYNKIEVIRLLISRGASVNVRCPLSGLTPLMLSVQFGHEAAARELLTLGANPGIGSNAGRLPLYMAIEKGFISIVKVLVTEFRANIRCPLSSEPSLPHAAYLSVLYNQSFMIPDLIALGADVDIGDASLCLSPLSLAALKGDEEAVKHLLEAGASPMSMSAAGRSAMFHAVERGHVSIVRILSEKFKYLPNTPCKTSHPLEFPLHVAVTFRQTACFGLLVQLGANRHLRNGHGLSAMDLAAQLNLLDDMTRALGETI